MSHNSSFCLTQPTDSDWSHFYIHCCTSKFLCVHTEIFPSIGFNLNCIHPKLARYSHWIYFPSVSTSENLHHSSECLSPNNRVNFVTHQIDYSCYRPHCKKEQKAGVHYEWISEEIEKGARFWSHIQHIRLICHWQHKYTNEMWFHSEVRMINNYFFEYYNRWHRYEHEVV